MFNNLDSEWLTPLGMWHGVTVTFVYAFHHAASSSLNLDQNTSNVFV